MPVQRRVGVLRPPAALRVASALVLALGVGLRRGCPGTGCRQGPGPHGSASLPGRARAGPHVRQARCGAGRRRAASRASSVTAASALLFYAAPVAYAAASAWAWCPRLPGLRVLVRLGGPRVAGRGSLGLRASARGRPVPRSTSDFDRGENAMELEPR
ncbi:MAG: hypothetical protein ACLTSX_00010 [Collinsella sp.]